MSKAGIKLAAKVFSVMQEARGELLRMAGKQDHASKSAHQDILLAQLLEKMKESAKKEFCEERVLRRKSSAILQ